MKKIGFLTFGHWSPSPASGARNADDAVRQTLELAVAAERIGLDGAWLSVHHFARQLSSPWPLLAAIAARTSRIEIGTAVIDMRYENPFHMAETAGTTDLIAGGRLQLGISRGAPEQVLDGCRHFGYQPRQGENVREMARGRGLTLLKLLGGQPFAQPNPQALFPNPPGLLRLEPHAPGLRERVWWGSASNATAIWAAQMGMNLQSSTLKADETHEPFHVQQARQIRAYREAWAEMGHAHAPRVSVSRSIVAMVTEEDEDYFGHDSQSRDRTGRLEGLNAIFGRNYAAEPDRLIEMLRQDEAVAEADTLLLTIPNQLGVAYNIHMLQSVLTHVAPAMGWRPATT